MYSRLIAPSAFLLILSQEHAASELKALQDQLQEHKDAHAQRVDQIEAELRTKAKEEAEKALG